MQTVRILIVSALILFLQAADLRAEDPEGESVKAVLITGASSGIGRHAAEQLAAAGYFVYAGARKDSDMEALNAIENIKAVRLDVTDASQIEAAVDWVRAEGRGLWGLVNNAGVNLVDPLIELREEDMQFLFDVNVFGVVRVTQAFAPLIIESKGRVVNISSISGILAGGPWIGYGMYSMSKHAVEAYTDALMREIGQLGVHVSAVEPGNFQSEIGASRCRRMLAQIEERTYRWYGEQMQEYVDDCKKYAESGYKSSGADSRPVSDAIQHALFHEQPKEHYLVTPNAFQARLTLWKQLEELIQLNRQQEHSLGLDELVDMLKEEWAVVNGDKEREFPPGLR